MPSLHEAIQCGPSQACNIDESNIPTHIGKPGQYDILQSILSHSSAAENSLSCSDRSEEPEAEPSKSSGSIIKSKNYEMPSLQREHQSSPITHTNPTSPTAPCMPLTRDEELTSSNSAGESSSTTSVTSFAFDHNKNSDSSDIDPSPGAEVEEVLRTEGESDPSETGTAQEGSVVPQRTPLPNSRAKRSNSPVAPARPKPPKPLRVTKRGSKWSAQEVTLLKRLKSNGMSWEYISGQLPGRTLTACRRHYTQSQESPPAASQNASAVREASRKPAVGAARARKQRWSAEEIDELNHLKDADVQWPEIAKQLPGRTLAACHRKWENLRKEAYMLSAMRQSVSKKDHLKGAVKEEIFESKGGDDEMLDHNTEEERPKRDIVEVEYSSSSDEEMSDSEVDDQKLDGKMRDESCESLLNEGKVESVSEEGMSDGSSDEDSSETEGESESESEDEVERKRKHATFFLKR